MVPSSDQSSTGYDSRPDTYAHMAEVRSRLLNIAVDLIRRAHRHDESKLGAVERKTFDEFTPKLRDSTYGSPEYQEFLAGMGEGLRHHYEHNDHHPEHFAGGIADMDLLQVVEMLCDWKAATMRHADGDLLRSIMQNAERFGYGDEFTRLLINTAVNMGWIDPPASTFDGERHQSSEQSANKPGSAATNQERQ